MLRLDDDSIDMYTQVLDISASPFGRVDFGSQICQEVLLDFGHGLFGGQSHEVE